MYFNKDIFTNIMSYVGDIKKEKQIIYKKALMDEILAINFDWMTWNDTVNHVELIYFLMWYINTCPYAFEQMLD